ncbi:MAG: response regulator [Chlorobi bacterium]|nr:response regulator [Chlorobiota bacterium]
MVKSNSGNRKLICGMLDSLSIANDSAAGRNGIELAGKIRGKTGLDTPVIMMFHATDDPKLFSAAREAGNCNTLIKPVKRAQLIELLIDPEKPKEALPASRNGVEGERFLNRLQCTVLIAEDNLTKCCLQKRCCRKSFPKQQFWKPETAERPLRFSPKTHPTWCSWTFIWLK